MTKSKQILITTILSLFGLFAVAPTVPASAAPGPAVSMAKTWRQCSDNFFGFPPWYRYLPMTNSCAPKFTKLSHVWVIALNIVDMLIRVAGIIAVGFIMWNGFRYMKSQGDPGAIQEAKTGILNSIIGLVTVIAAVAVVQYVAGSIG